MTREWLRLENGFFAVTVARGGFVVAKAIEAEFRAVRVETRVPTGAETGSSP